VSKKSPVSFREQLPVAVLGPLATRLIVQTVLPSFCTSIDPVVILKFLT